MTINEFIKACEKAGCTVEDGRVMFGDIELGIYGIDGFDVRADAANEYLRHCWLYKQVDVNTFKVLLKDLIESFNKSKEDDTHAKKD
jgi:hypothetical protein